MKKKPVIECIFYFSILFIALTACNSKQSDSTSSYQPVFSMDTLKGNALLFGFPSFSYSETAEPFIKYLNANLPGFHVRMKACASYEEYLEYLKSDKFDLTLINGFEALEAIHDGYSIIGKIADDDAYTAVIFTQKNAGIKNITDLKGKRIALASFKMLPGTMMPLYYLYQNGLDVNHDIVRVNVSSFESAIIAAYVGKSEAGACLKRSWDVYVKNHPEILSKLELKWETSPLIHNALLVRDSVDNKKISQLSKLFLSMHTTAEGKEALKKLEISGFESANSDTYKPMMDFKKKYDSVIF